MAEINISPEYANSGISIRYTKSTRRVFISGWYDSFVGIDGQVFTLTELLQNLGVTKADLKKVMDEMANG